MTRQRSLQALGCSHSCLICWVRYIPVGGDWWMCKSVCAPMTLKRWVTSVITPFLRCWASGHSETIGNRIRYVGHWNGLHVCSDWSRSAYLSLCLQVIVTLPVMTKLYKYGWSWVFLRSVSITCLKRTTGGHLKERVVPAVQTLNSSTTQVAQSMVLIASRVALAVNILKSAIMSSCSTTKRQRAHMCHLRSAILTWVLAWNERSVHIRELATSIPQIYSRP